MYHIPQDASYLDGCPLQGRKDIIKFPLSVYDNPNHGLWEYKVKTGRSYPNTKEEWEVYKTWEKGTHGYVCEHIELSSAYEGPEEDEIPWESWHPCQAWD